MGPLSHRVLMLCDAALAELPLGETQARVRAIRDGLREPLRVVVAGRLKAGKSTLVNALLRQRIAAVDVGECTQVVTWFRFGAQERAEVRARDGSTWDLPLEADGSLPRRLGAEPDDIDRVTVWLSNEALRHLTLIDTPGLDSLNTQYSNATTRLLALDDDSRAAISEADALVFLMPQLGSADEQLLRAFHDLFTGEGLSAVNVVGVLSKVDTLAGDATDPMQVGNALATRFAARLRAEVASVVPVIGLLAETAATDAFSEREANALRTLAAVPADRREELLLSADWFVESDANPLPREQREGLLALLDLHGLRRATELIAAGYGDTNVLLARLEESSGIEPLRALLRELFTERADALKSHVALNELERVSYVGDGPLDAALGHLRYAIEDLRLDPAMQRVNELEALRLWATSGITLPDDFAADLERITRDTDVRERLGLAPGATTDTVRTTALDKATRWLEFQNDPRTPVEATHIAQLVRDSLVLMWQETAP
jgi:hypothetical protein